MRFVRSGVAMMLLSLPLAFAPKVTNQSSVQSGVYRFVEMRSGGTRWTPKTYRSVALMFAVSDGSRTIFSIGDSCGEFSRSVALPTPFEQSSMAVPCSGAGARARAILREAKAPRVAEGRVQFRTKTGRMVFAQSSEVPPVGTCVVEQAKSESLVGRRVTMGLTIQLEDDCTNGYRTVGYANHTILFGPILAHANICPGSDGLELLTEARTALVTVAGSTMQWNLPGGGAVVFGAIEGTPVLVHSVPPGGTQ